jgi:hypothetical protein
MRYEWMLLDEARDVIAEIKIMIAGCSAGLGRHG